MNPMQYHANIRHKLKIAQLLFPQFFFTKRHFYVIFIEKEKMLKPIGQIIKKLAESANGSNPFYQGCALKSTPPSPLQF